ncbi:AGE family epimerase/isomerase [Pseudoduganella lutea]|uniref:AGE family epimerase/isomerase n=1 Tax=Pseudoduganella lutea TaxID=321985 RepID=A0A4P6KUX6_9BURK|nr:AGE family epimerase/isomerase [Pseudoduganella lutea]QBE61918.1 AGE family epimerase/isomerase [Pseudoduganella lutea]
MTPNFRSREFLLGHIRHTLAFYAPRCSDPDGGFYHFYRDDGTVYDRHTRHLVSSTRFVFNFAMAFRQFGDPADAARMRAGLAFLRCAHRDPRTGGYAWQLDWRGSRREVIDATNHCYGLAFVLLAYAHALHAGVEEARDWISETFFLMERHFWEPEHGLYADEASADWSQRSPYRGQNANMHACEALIAAYEASGEPAYVRRAAMLARSITVRQAAQSDGLVWEHYREDWSVDPDYNRDAKTNIFRPWGFQPGHLTEWAKLLLILERHPVALGGDTAWLLPRAVSLFDAAMRHAWDERHGGLAYGFAPDGTVCDGDKYFWVQAESLAAAALLGARTGEARYWDWYERLWRYSWEHFVDHRHGAWYRILGPANEKLTDEKSPAGKTDYHTMGACYEVLNVLNGLNVLNVLEE